MPVTKPFFKETSFAVLFVAILLIALGLFLSARAIFMSSDAATPVMWGVFFGVGIAFLIMSATLRQQEKKLNGK